MSFTIRTQAWRTCTLLCKQWHEVTLRHTFRRVTFLLYKEDGLVCFRHVISQYPWLASFIREANLVFKRWSEGEKQNPGEYLLPVLEELARLAPQLHTLIFDNAHCRQGWTSRTLSRHLQALPPIATVQFDYCTFRLTDIKMIMRSFPKAQHLHLSSSMVSGDSKTGLSPADVPTLSSLRLRLWGSHRSNASHGLPPAVVKLLTSSVVANGVPCVSLDLPVMSWAAGEWRGVLENLARALGPSLKFFRLYGDSGLESQCESPICSYPSLCLI